MKVVRVGRPGGREALIYTDGPNPTPEHGQVLVAIEFAGVNFIDVYMRQGLYQLPRPFTLGILDSAGSLAILSGAAALSVRKGARLHRSFGTVFAPTRKSVRWLGAALFRVEGPLIVELWVLGDLVSKQISGKTRQASRSPLVKFVNVQRKVTNEDYGL